VEYWNDPAAPKPNSLVPACGVLAADDSARLLKLGAVLCGGRAN
jgi:hypothetical protein